MSAVTSPTGISCTAVVISLTFEIPFHSMASSIAAMRTHVTARPPKVSTSLRTRMRVRLRGVSQVAIPTMHSPDMKRRQI